MDWLDNDWSEDDEGGLDVNCSVDDEAWIDGGLDVGDPEDDEAWLERGLDVSGGEDNEAWLEGGLNVDGPEDDKAWLEGGLKVDWSDVTEGENMDVGVAVCPWQLPLLTETSSIAKSPVWEDPTIPSNVT